jgi:long-chain acyl-CoA synthetase
MHVDRVCARGAERLRAHPSLLDELGGRIAPDSAALLLPGETIGEPADSAPSHSRLVSAAVRLGEALPVQRDDVVLGALPASRPSFRALRLACLVRGAELVLARVDEGAIAVDLVETQPTLLVAESSCVRDLAERARDILRKRGALARRLYDWGLAQGAGRTLADVSASAAPRSLKLRFAEAALTGALRRRWVGGRLRTVVALGDPVDDETRRLFAAFGIALLEGEDTIVTCGLLALNTPSAFRPGSLGRLVPGLEGRADGAQLQVRTTSSEGWKPSGRKLRIDPDGWVVPTNHAT